MASVSKPFVATAIMQLVERGSDTGFRSHFTLLPEENLGLVVASNYSGTPMNDLAEGILDILLGYEPTVPRPSIR
jgi:CubicO group peptidase (beta-lactamase class C family)